MREYPYKALSVASDVREIINTLKKNGFLGYVVGGAVRDLLLSIPVSDWDLATDATPGQLIKIFPKVTPTGIRHGTVTVRYVRAQYELTTFRTDGDYAGQRRLERSCLTRNIEEDLRHRDFTINAMAYDPVTNKLIDPFGGQKDLRRKILRGVDDPLSRFMEDGLRPYRAIRFSLTLDLRIEEKTWKAIPLSLEKARATSWERIRDEILKILEATKPSKAFEMMRKTGLLALVIPEVLEGYHKKDSPSGDVYHHLLDTVDAAPPLPILRLACLLHDIGKAELRKHLQTGYESDAHQRVSVQMADVITRRLRLSNHQRRYIHELLKNHDLPLQTKLRGAEVRRFLSRVDPKVLDDLLILSKAHSKASGADAAEARRIDRLREKSKQMLSEDTPLTVSQLAINGETVKRILGIREGAQVGRILGQLMEIVLEEPAKNNPHDLARLVEEIGQS